FRIAREMEVDIVILPIANLEEYNKRKALRGIWPRVQESYLFGLKSSLNGWMAGMHFTGHSGIFAPLSITEKGDGVLSISSFYEGNCLVTSNINIKKLHKAREKAAYHEDKNIEFEKNYIKKTYNIN
ncbi:MAG: nitrilase, partial [Candidatus Caldatribacteriota bacterium]|nr:nitrilase [Candidatus Caldatribacteriota bacterium]